MIVTNVNEGTKADYSLDGSNLTISVPRVGELTLDLQAKQTSVRQNIDVSLDRGFLQLAAGIGSWYVATIEIPPVATELYETGATDEDGNPVMASRELPLDTSQVKLHLWGLPENIFDVTEAIE